ncbi:hypothetical protein Drose_05590 [Dactylosporangium roseum]|uniref:Uncharacterized protein n=1 Tax=Dactylosporangium roseum TaxID=47989 RepID=A0ABY5Z7C8_9ACTN|nr:hypothetical protein [Dactylosporangium roseum]UWZ37742.1 hypothetical protein Drose_05590 [Dactylosporangium roseum]
MGAMETADGKWRVEVGGTGTVVVWYTLHGPGVRRNLPSLNALVAALAEHGIDVGELREI